MNDKFIQSNTPAVYDLQSFESPYIKKELYNKHACLDSISRGKNSVINSSDRYVNDEYLKNE
jgi:hypothetical protein